MNPVTTFHHKSFETDDPLRKYCAEHLSKLHPLQEELKEKTLASKEIATIMLGDPEVMLLNECLMKSIHAKRVLDVGTFTGMSALTAALAIPDDGQVITMDIDHAVYDKYGLPIIKKGNLEKKIIPKTEPALKTLDDLIAAGESGKFDFAFIDADKPNYSNYFDRCVTLLRSGGIIAIDNALWGGAVANKEIHNNDKLTAHIDNCNKRVRDDDRVTNILLTAGDGLHLAFKK